jgi:predicted SnoaL-like aldol condensation-catalyzing enzyme
MTIHRFDPTDHPVIASVSRRAVVQRLGGASLMAASVCIAPKLVQAQEATPANDLEANKVLARRWHDEIFEQGNLAVADEILTPDFAWRGPPNTSNPSVGPEAIKQAATEVRAYFHDLVLTDDDEIAQGDRVAIRWTLTGTVQTESGAIPVVYTGMDIFRIQGGKLAELWQNTDDYGLAQQLGEIPAEGTPAASTPTT